MLPGRQFSLEDEGEDENGDEMAVLERKVNEAAMPESALRVCLKELKRYRLSASVSALCQYVYKITYKYTLNGVRDDYELSTKDR